MNPFLRQPLAYRRTPVRAEQPDPKNPTPGVQVLRLYDPIDADGDVWGVSAKEFTAALDALPDDTTEIQLLINSPGGDVWEGLAILNALRAHPATTVAVVEGIAASAASFIAVSCDQTRMWANSEMFIHNAWGLVVGNAADCQKMAANLEHEDRNQASIYAAKSGGSVDEWLAALAAESWYSAQEALDAGLVDAVVEPPSADAAKKAGTAKARFDLAPLSRKRGGCTCPTASAHADLQHQDGCALHQTPAAERGGSTDPKEGEPIVAFSDEQLTTLRQRLGVSDDADEMAILAALDEALTERADPPAASTQIPDGMSLVDTATLDELRTNAQQGVDARAEQMRARREQLVVAAVNDGRIPPSRREAWLAQLASDAGSEQVLAQLEPGLIPVGALGADNAPDVKTEDDKVFALLFGEQKG